MVRPQKDRIVAFNPEISYFKPRGIPMIDLEESLPDRRSARGHPIVRSAGDVP